MIGGVTRHKLPHLSRDPSPPCKQALEKKSGTVDSIQWTMDNGHPYITDNSIQWTPW